MSKIATVKLLAYNINENTKEIISIKKVVLKSLLKDGHNHVLTIGLQNDYPIQEILEINNGSNNNITLVIASEVYCSLKVFTTEKIYKKISVVCTSEAKFCIGNKGFYHQITIPKKGYIKLTDNENQEFYPGWQFKCQDLVQYIYDETFSYKSMKSYQGANLEKIDFSLSSDRYDVDCVVSKLSREFNGKNLPRDIKKIILTYISDYSRNLKKINGYEFIQQHFEELRNKEEGEAIAKDRGVSYVKAMNETPYQKYYFLNCSVIKGDKSGYNIWKLINILPMQRCVNSSSEMIKQESKSKSEKEATDFTNFLFCSYEKNYNSQFKNLGNEELQVELLNFDEWGLQ